jgi:hypothetical protein
MEEKIVYMPYILEETVRPLVIDVSESDIEKIREKYCNTKRDLSWMKFYSLEVIDSIDNKDLTE